MTEPSAAAPASPARTDLPFRLLALAWVITGGLTAAVTAAFQVLVGGVMQGVLGTAQQRLAARAPGRGVLLIELLTWNLGGLAVIGGTVLGAPLLVDAGGALLVVTMVLMLRAVGRRTQGPTWLLWVFRAALMLTAVSIPVGLVLAHLRAA